MHLDLTLLMIDFLNSHHRLYPTSHETTMMLTLHMPAEVFTVPICAYVLCLATDMRDKLRKWREENYRNSEQIVDVGEELINEHASKLGDDSKYNCTDPTEMSLAFSFPQDSSVTGASQHCPTTKIQNALV